MYDWEKSEHAHTLIVNKCMGLDPGQETFSKLGQCVNCILSGHDSQGAMNSWWLTPVRKVALKDLEESQYYYLHWDLGMPMTGEKQMIYVLLVAFVIKLSLTY